MFARFLLFLSCSTAFKLSSFAPPPGAALQRTSPDARFKVQWAVRLPFLPSNPFFDFFAHLLPRTHPLSSSFFVDMQNYYISELITVHHKHESPSVWACFHIIAGCVAIKPLRWLIVLVWVVRPCSYCNCCCCAVSCWCNHHLCYDFCWLPKWELYLLNGLDSFSLNPLYASVPFIIALPKVVGISALPPTLDFAYLFSLSAAAFITCSHSCSSNPSPQLE